jgi:hypothetical protein
MEMIQVSNANLEKIREAEEEEKSAKALREAQGETDQ